MEKKKKRILWIIFFVAVVCVLSFLIYFLLKKFNITSISTLRDFIAQFGGWAWAVFLVTQIVLSVPIFVVPFEDELWVTLSIILFGAKIGFLLSIIGMIAVSSILYFCGNKFGIKLAQKFVGKKELDNVQKKSEIKSALTLPFLYLIPLFPHDILCVTSGINKINFAYFFVVTLLLRSIEIVAICFMGGDFIDWSTLSVFDWVVFANLVVIDIYLMTKLQKYMENKLEKRDK